MKKIFSVSLILIIPFIFISSAYSFGIGVFGFFNEGRIERDYIAYTSSDYDIETRSNDYLYGLGLLYDTSIIGEKFFNYRLNIGFGKYIIDNANEYSFEMRIYSTICRTGRII